MSSKSDSAPGLDQDQRCNAEQIGDLTLWYWQITTRGAGNKDQAARDGSGNIDRGFKAGAWLFEVQAFRTRDAQKKVECVASGETSRLRRVLKDAAKVKVGRCRRLE